MIQYRKKIYQEMTIGEIMKCPYNGVQGTKNTSIDGDRNLIDY